MWSYFSFLHILLQIFLWVPIINTISDWFRMVKLWFRGVEKVVFIYLLSLGNGLLTVLISSEVFLQSDWGKGSQRMCHFSTVLSRCDIVAWRYDEPGLADSFRVWETVLSSNCPVSTWSLLFQSQTRYLSWIASLFQELNSKNLNAMAFGQEFWKPVLADCFSEPEFFFGGSSVSTRVKFSVFSDSSHTSFIFFVSSAWRYQNGNFTTVFEVYRL